MILGKIMIFLNSDILLANVLVDRESIEICKLKKMKENIEKKFTNIYIDISMNNLIWAVQEMRPDLFEWRSQELKIRKVRKFNDKYVMSIFNWRLPRGIRKRFLDACKK